MNSLVCKYKKLPVQVKASFCFLICSFLQRAVYMLTTPIFTRILSTSEYGQLGVFNSWYHVAIVIIPVCLSASMHTQGLVKFSEERDVFTSSLMGLVTLLVLIWCVIYFAFRSFWNETMGLTTIQMICLLFRTWTFSVIGFWGNEQRVNYEYRRLVIVSIIVSVVQPLVGIILVLVARDKVTARIVGITMVELVAYSWMFIISVKRGKTLYSKRFWKYGILINLPLLPHYISSTVLSSADRIMIRDMVGYNEAGIYDLAYSAALVMSMFNSALLATLTPWMFRKIKERKEIEIAPVAYGTVGIIALANLLMILFAPEVVMIFAPKPYYAAVGAIPPVAMSVFFMYCYGLFSRFAFYKEKTAYIMIASVGGAVLNIALNYIFIPVFGYIAAGYTTLFCYIVYSICHNIFMNKVCGGVRPFSGRKILSIAALFLLIGFMLLFTYDYPLIRYGIGLVGVVIGVVNREKIMKLFKGLMEIK